MPGRHLSCWSRHQEDFAALAFFVGGTVGPWFLPDEHLPRLVSLIALGLFFDVWSFCCHVSTLLTKQFSSGFPGVGLFFYVWFVLAYRKALLAPYETSWAGIALYKLLDLLLLVAIHLAFQAPMFLQEPRRRSPQEGEQSDS